MLDVQEHCSEHAQYKAWNPVYCEKHNKAL